MSDLKPVLLVISVSTFFIMSYSRNQRNCGTACDLGRIDNQTQTVYTKDLRCHNVSKEYVFQNFSCYAKSFNRSFSGQNLHLTFKMPMKNISVKCFQLLFTPNFFKIFACFKTIARFSYKYGTIYREVESRQNKVELLLIYLVWLKVLHSPLFKICEIAKEIDGNKFVAWLINAINENSPGAIHPCPYNVS